MTSQKQNPLPEGIKVLTEAEIQEKLYGEYWGRRRRRANSKDTQWTGVEILGGELIRLRSELMALRQERERLLSQLARRPLHSVRATDSSERETPLSHGDRGRHLWLRGTGLLLLLGLLVYPLGFHLIQASPGSPEPSPYTIQVAVYDVKAPADRALAHLLKLGYSAFLVDMRRLNGKPRYRLYVGHFVTSQEANLERRKLSLDPRFPDAFVRLQ